jgi:hypothetical protein
MKAPVNTGAFFSDRHFPVCTGLKRFEIFSFTVFALHKNQITQTAYSANICLKPSLRFTDLKAYF